LYFLLKPLKVTVFSLRLYVGALNHLFENFDLCILLFDFVLEIFDGRLGQLPYFHLGLKKLLFVVIAELGLASESLFGLVELGL